MHAAFLFFFFFNDTATTEIYTLSLHDALPISWEQGPIHKEEDQRGMIHRSMDRLEKFTGRRPVGWLGPGLTETYEDRKSTRLNSSHLVISYAVFCLEKKKKRKRSWPT